MKKNRAWIIIAIFSVFALMAGSLAIHHIHSSHKKRLSYQQSTLESVRLEITDLQERTKYLESLIPDSLDDIYATEYGLREYIDNLRTRIVYLESLNGSLQDYLSNSVVYIHAIQEGVIIKEGSGVIIDNLASIRDLGYQTMILTAKHVIKSYYGDETYDGTISFFQNKHLEEELPYQVVAVSAEYDLALLLVRDHQARQVSSIATETPEQTTRTAVIGFPAPYDMTEITEGLCTGSYHWTTDGEKLIHISAFVNYGNSGGAVFNLETEELIGIMVRFSYGYTGSAVPPEEINEFLNDYLPHTK